MDILPKYDLQFVDLAPSYLRLLKMPVFKLRIGMHNLGQQWLGQWSENHAVLYFLLGGGRCVRLNLKPTEDGGVAKLYLTGHNFTESNSLFPEQFKDFALKDCPRDFDPEVENRTRGLKTVKEVITPLLSANLHRYRFMEVEESKVGCRHWV
jgi:hypothetical protein